MLKKVVLHSVATALANNVFPVPLINGIKACIVRKLFPETLGGITGNKNVCNGPKLGSMHD